MTVADGSRGKCGRPAVRIAITLSGALSLLLTAAGCGGGGSSGSMPAPPPAMVKAPAILVQPMNRSVPMGLTAVYSVSASGTAPSYQWAKNGAVIAGATASTYVSPPVAFTDTGATFRVTVRNSGGTVTSRAATLTVTARAPAAGDLRFQQVDAASTLNGYGNAGVGLQTDIPGRGAFYYSPALGSPLYAGAGDCASPPEPATGIGCAWFYSVTPLGLPGLTAGYAGDFYTNFAQDLLAPSPLAFGGTTTPISSASVITSLDLEPPNALFALSWVQSAQQSGFEMTVQTVAPADLQAAAAQAGASGQVLTAVSNNGGQITFLAYGWQSDTATAYETQAVTASPANAPAAAAGLAAAGYIITATGLADSSGDILLIGTRVQGDTLPRPFVIAQNSSETQMMQQEGYALVGVIVNLAQPAYPYSFLGER
jgi:hypothetical protein